METSKLGVFAFFITMALPLTGCGDRIEEPPVAGNINGIDYVAVRDEPQHRHEYENDRVRIYDVLLPPGYATLYHAHTRDTIYVAVQGSRLKSRTLVGSYSPPLGLPVPSGFVFWREHANEPLIHEVTNVGDETARLVGVELKFGEGTFLRQPLAGYGLALDDTYPKVRAYQLSLAPGESTGEMEWKSAGLVIGLTEATLSLEISDATPRIASFESASWEWFDQPGRVILSNVGASSFEAVLYELPFSNRQSH